MSYTNHVTSWSNPAIVLLVLDITYKERRVPVFCFEVPSERGFIAESLLPMPKESLMGPFTKGPPSTIPEILGPII